MRSTPAPSSLWLLLPCLAAPLAAQHSAGRPIAIVLPDAYSGVPYTTRIVGALGLATGDFRCDPLTPGLPDGISLVCDSGIKLLGTSSTSSDLPIRATVRITDVLNHTVELDLTFTLRPAIETVIVGGTKPIPASSVSSDALQRRPARTAPPSNLAARPPAPASENLSPAPTYSKPVTLETYARTPSPSEVSPRAFPGTTSAAPPVSELPPATASDTPPPIYTFVETTPIAEGATTIEGLISPQPAKSDKLKIEAWIKSPGRDESLAPLKPTSADVCCPASVQQVSLSDNKYSITFLKPLSPGQTIRLALVDASGKQLALRRLNGGAVLPTTIPTTIDLPQVGLDVTSEVVAGATTITGTVNLPPNPVAPDPKATPPILGNLPGIIVWVKDADLALWSQAPLQSASGTATLLPQPVDPTSHAFTATLKTALKPGQKIRVDAIPPLGRTFANAPTPPELRETTNSGDSWFFTKVESSTVLVQPSIATTLTEGTTTINGVATAPSTGTAISVAVLKVEPRAEGGNRSTQPTRPSAQHVPSPTGPAPSSAEPANTLDTQTYSPVDTAESYEMRDPDLTAVCITADDLSRYSKNQILMDRGRLMSITSSGSNTLTAAVDQSGTFKLTLAEALKEDDQIQILQVLPAGTTLAKPQYRKCASPTQRVRYAFDWHRTNLNFVAGVLISNSSYTSASSANFSQANQFYAFNLDRAWQLPGVDCVDGKPFGSDRYKGHCQAGRPGWHASRAPGINTYFEGRLTSIPVSTPAANPTSSGATTTSTTTTGATGATGTTGTTTTATTSGTTPPVSSLLTSQKVFRVSAGVFFPWVLTHGPGHHPNGIFFAPLVKGGFDTVTGATSSPDVILPSGVQGTLSYQHAYNFFAFGGRLGNMELSASHDRAPKIDHYLDVTIGRYSNLQSFICHQFKPGQTPLGQLPGSSCATDYFAFYSGGPTNVVESRKQLFRLDFEGLVRIPVPLTAIPFYIGFNANISQHTVGAEALDHGYAPPDDIRILFGTKIDMGALLSTLNLGAH